MAPVGSVRLVVVLPESEVMPVHAQQLAVRAAFHRNTIVEHHDLVHDIQRSESVRDPVSYTHLTLPTILRV